MLRRLQLTLLPAAGLIAGCAVEPARAPAAQPAVESILERSLPAAGSTVAEPVNSLELHFNPPARLDELTISGSDGTMPMMVHAAGETADYSIPLPGLSSGQYSANWKAFAAGREYRGSIAFTVK